MNSLYTLIKTITVQKLFTEIFSFNFKKQIWTQNLSLCNYSPCSTVILLILSCPSAYPVFGKWISLSSLFALQTHFSLAFISQKNLCMTCLGLKVSIVNYTCMDPTPSKERNQSNLIALVKHFSPSKPGIVLYQNDIYSSQLYLNEETLLQL